jgi:type II secretory pathway component PulJ
MDLKKRGYSIIEIVIYTALYGIVLASVFNFNAIFIKNYNIGIDKMSSYDEMRFALSRMVREIRAANSINIPDNESDALYITITQKDEHGDFETKNVKYFVDTIRNRMYRRVNGTSNLLSENIAGIDFSWIDCDELLKIDIMSTFSGYSLSTLVYTRICSR